MKVQHLILCVAFAAGAASAQPRAMALFDSDLAAKGAFVSVPGPVLAGAGVNPGDIIAAVDGHAIRTAAEYQAWAGRHAGGPLRLKVVRGGGRTDEVLVGLPGGGAAIAAVKAPAPGRPAPGPAPIASPPPAPVRQAPLAVRWSSFRDPTEGAFTLQVPAGWRVSGGMRRVTALDLRPGVQAVSPDGSIVLFFGDPSVQVFALPNALLAQMGVREGMIYPNTPNMTVARYQPGDVFARTWGARRIGSFCRQPEVRAARARPDAGRSIDMAFGAGGVRSTIRAGEAVFACTLNGAPGGAYAFAATQLAETTGNGIWQAMVMAGFVARSDRVRDASRLLDQMVGSYAYDPTWMRRQQGLTMDVSRITTQTNDAVSRSIHDSFEVGKGRYDHIDAFDQAIRGVETFNDPVRGPVELTNFEHQWRLPNGTTVGTHSATPPQPGAVEMGRAGR